MAYVGCRLLAIFVALKVLFILPDALFIVFFHSVLDGLLGFLVSSGGSIAMIIVLWFGAAWIARKIVPSLVDDASLPKAKEESVLRSVIPATGLFLILVSVPDLMNQLAFWFVLEDGVSIARGARPSQPTILDFAAALARPAFSIAFGLYLLASPVSVVALVSSLRRWQSTPGEGPSDDSRL